MTTIEELAAHVDAQALLLAELIAAVAPRQSPELFMAKLQASANRATVQMDHSGQGMQEARADRIRTSVAKLLDLARSARKNDPSGSQTPPLG